MRKFLGVVLLFLTGFVGIAFMQKSPAQDGVAQCIAKSLDSEGRVELGASSAVADGETLISFSRMSYLGCRGLMAAFADSDNRKSLAKALFPLMEPYGDFRRGLQSGAWARQGYSGVARTRLTELTLSSAQNTLARVWGATCDKATSEQLDEMRDVELPLLTAIVGTHGWVPTAQSAQKLAEDVIAQGKYHTLMSAKSVEVSCQDTAMAKGLELQQSQLSQFLQGHHPEAPGCRVTRENAEYVLSCTVNP